MPTELRLRLRADLSGESRGQQRVAATVGPDGAALVLLADEVDAAAFTSRLHNRPVPVTLLRYANDGVYRTEVADLAIAFPRIQPLPDDESLIVGARCGRLKDGSVERNAQIYGADGTLRREFTLGDGINDVQTTAKGTIWVSYFDEGVFGSIGIGAAGLVHFDARGIKQWEYTPPPGLEIICDCYALNVTEDAAWAYYYVDFPLVRVTPDGQVQTWDAGISGALAFATDGQRVLFYGSWGPDRFRCMLGRLGETAVEDLQERTLVFPDGRPVEGRDVMGRGPLLHAFDDTGWYQLDIRDIR